LEMDFRGALEPDPVARSTVLFIRPTDSSFILTDQKIIESEYTVKAFAINQGKDKLKYFFKLFELALFLLYNQRRSKAFITWFGDYHAVIMVLIGRLFRKITVIFAGGQEAICYKELGKGVYLKWFRGGCAKYAIRNATLVLPNHRSLIYHENHFYDENQPHIDGIRHYVDNLKCRMEIIPNGIDHNRINLRKEIHKEQDLVLTVGTMNRLGDFYNKGFDLFIEAARLCQDLRFVLIGIKKEFLGWVETVYGVSKLTNLTIVSSFCSDEVLSEYYNRANVYVQVSITEGMPVSLGEAMLCECTPVGSDVNGIPDAIGPHGVIIHKRTPEDLRLAIRRAMELRSGKAAREYTIANYSVSRRRERIMEVFRDFIR
jgi:glycosyltransferase involved in cell wall biosynthesis